MFTILFGSVGAWAGSHIGIAAFGTAISGKIPLLLMGVSAGYVADILTGK